MMSRFLALFLSLTSLLLSQSQTRPIPYPITEEPGFARAVEAGTRTREGAPGSSYWTNFARYAIDAELDPETAIVKGTAKLTYVNRSPERVTRLLIHLRQNLHKEGALRNTPVEITGGVTISAVRLGGKEIEEKFGRGSYRVNGTVMTVRPREAIAPGGEDSLEIDWSFRVPQAGRAPRMGHEDHHVFYLGYWYPQFAVLDDVNGWVADPYMGSGEFYMGYADYDVSITVPTGWIVRATGALKNPEEVLTEKTRARLAEALESRDVVRVVTKSDLGSATQPSATGKLTWKFHADNVRDFAISASDRYLWDATHAVVVGPDGTRRETPCMIHAVYEANARGWEKTAEYARHTIEFVSKTVYAYPWPHMTVCEGIVGGGMEYPMMTDIGVTGSAGGIQDVTAHEIIHMWFPMIIGTNEKARSWMDEGLTEFITSLTGADYWKQDRSIRSVYSQYRRQARLNTAFPCMQHTDTFPDSGRMNYYFVAYGKPSAVMHQLKDMLGEDVFWQAFHAYVNTWAFKHPYHYDLFNTFNHHAGQNLDWYFRTWFYETWILDSAVKSVAEKDGKTEIVIEDLGDAPGVTKVKVSFEGGSNETLVIPASHWLTGARTKTLTVPAGVNSVEIDPDGKSLDVDLQNNRWSR